MGCMKYDKATTDSLISKYTSGVSAADIAAELGVPERSVIAKLASLDIYKKKEYMDKRGNKPVKKEEYIERIASLLATDVCLVESLEKVNKNVLKMLDDALSLKFNSNTEL